jgi:hypothetical protein
VEHYLCERCNPRPVELEIVMDPQPHYATPGLTNYITLLRGDLQLRQGSFSILDVKSPMSVDSVFNFALI